MSKKRKETIAEIERKEAFTSFRTTPPEERSDLTNQKINEYRENKINKRAFDKEKGVALWKEPHLKGEKTTERELYKMFTVDELKIIDPIYWRRTHKGRVINPDGSVKRFFTKNEKGINIDQWGEREDRIKCYEVKERKPRKKAWLKRITEVEYKPTNRKTNKVITLDPATLDIINIYNSAYELLVKTNRTNNKSSLYRALDHEKVNSSSVLIFDRVIPVSLSIEELDGLSYEEIKRIAKIKAVNTVVLTQLERISKKIHLYSTEDKINIQNILTKIESANENDIHSVEKDNDEII